MVSETVGCSLLPLAGRGRAVLPSGSLATRRRGAQRGGSLPPSSAELTAEGAAQEPQLAVLLVFCVPRVAGLEACGCVVPAISVLPLPHPQSPFRFPSFVQEHVW